MGISVTCDQCGKEYDLADDMVGKRTECRLCGESLDVSLAEPSPESDGVSDRQIRIGAAIVLPVTLIGLAVCVATFRELDTNHLMMIVFGPFGIAYSIAAMIDPDLVRAAGRFGGHLPFRYKVISGLIGVAGLGCSLLLAKILLMP